MVEGFKQTATRKSIKWATLELMKSKPLKDLAITEVVNLAEVSRASFYNNFDSLYDVILEVETNFFEKMPIQTVVFSRKYPGKVESFEECLKYEQDHMNILKILFGKNGDPNLNNMMVKHTAGFLQKTKLINLDQYSEIEKELIEDAIISAFWGPTKFWILNEDAFTIKQLDTIVVKLVNQLLELFRTPLQLK